MAAEIINLRQARKRKNRAERVETAEQNRIKFGLSKSERAAATRSRSDLQDTVDGHRITTDRHDSDPSEL